MPRRARERIERVGFALARPPAFWARRVDELGNVRERRLAGARRLIVSDIGQHHRQLLVGYGHDSAILAVDDRDRASPVALSRNQPVAHPVADRRPSNLMLFRVFTYRLDRIGGLHPLREARVYRHPANTDSPNLT